MKVRAFATVCLIASFGLLGGCAGTPDGDYASNWAVGDHPQMLMPGAVLSDVKGLAMGAAQSKGWTIVKSTDARVVMERELDPTSPSAAALGVTGSTVRPKIVVTSAFVEQSGGVNVALGAELLAQSPGDNTYKRTDITEKYRDALNQSLESLRTNWTANRQRLAAAIPPLPGPSEGTPPPSSNPDAANNPLVQTWGQAVAESPARPDAGAPPEPAPGPVAQPPVEPPPVEPPAAVASPPVRSEPPAPRANGPAPVLDASPALSGGAMPEMTLPPAGPESVPPGENMLTLSQAGGTGTWAYYAEQYARLRGCNVTQQGAQLIESRADGEVHKVTCTGADSFLVKCQNGVCRGLQ